jgi:hypothetical protein
LLKAKFFVKFSKKYYFLANFFLTIKIKADKKRKDYYLNLNIALFVKRAILSNKAGELVVSFLF